MKIASWQLNSQSLLRPECNEHESFQHCITSLYKIISKYFKFLNFPYLYWYTSCCISRSGRQRMQCVCLHVSPRTVMICVHDSTHAPHDHSNQWPKPSHCWGGTGHNIQMMGEVASGIRQEKFIQIIFHNNSAKLYYGRIPFHISITSWWRFYKYESLLE
jgi:hypothetical protein